MQPDPLKPPMPSRITKIHEIWSRQVRYLRITHVSLVVIATTSSILVSAGIFKDYFGVANPLAIVAAIAIGLVSAFALGDKANNFRNAWRVLNAAIIRYEAEPEFTTEQLIKAYEEAEQLIGDVKSAPKA